MLLIQLHEDPRLLVAGALWNHRYFKILGLQDPRTFSVLGKSGMGWESRVWGYGMCQSMCVQDKLDWCVSSGGVGGGWRWEPVNFCALHRCVGSGVWEGSGDGSLSNLFPGLQDILVSFK